jgi:Domain of unknown function (DUF5916)
MRSVHLAVRLVTVLMLVGAGARAQEGPVPPLAITRSVGELAVDGDLGDAGWQGAALQDRFFETSPGDNIPAKVATRVRFTYDDRYFYIGVEADDPEPGKIRAPFVDRDQVFGTDDNIAILLDTRNDRRSALELRVSPRGIQGDAVFNDANGSEDFAPDFFYDTAAKITGKGWQAEYRIPFSSLRYPKDDPQTWRVLVWRNYPRDFRYAFHSAPIPRDSNCFVCHAHELTGLTGLPSTKHLIAAPYASASGQEQRPAIAGTEYQEETNQELGVDIKWNPTADSALDATINPDFSQIESDEAQIAANQRFALDFPEKRPFFLEGIDLFDTPIRAVNTRSITSPRWGLRGTGKLGSTGYTLLLVEDRGGGTVILPGPTFSDGALQDFRSQVAIGRVRHDLGRSFAGFLFTGREIDGGGHNWVFGPDFQWRPTESDIVTGELLLSDTQNPERLDLHPTFDGRSSSGHAAFLSWSHQKRDYDWRLRAETYDDDFRADSGFVTQVGGSDLQASYGRRFFPERGLFRFLRAYGVAGVQRDTDNEALGHDYFAGVFLSGRKNLQANIELHPEHQVRFGDRLLTQRYLFYFAQFDPGQRLARLAVDGSYGEQADFFNGDIGDGISVGLTATIRPTDHLEMLASFRHRSLNVSNERGSGRLFTAQIQRLKATYTFSSRQLVRVIGQLRETEFDPSLFGFPVPKQTGGFESSVLYSYKLNWQTVLFVGYGDERVLTENDDLFGTGRSVFFKISYAIQR